MTKARKISYLFALATVSALVSGCVVLAPFVQAWKNVGATANDRRTLFNQQIKRFGEALYWGRGDAALFVDPEADPSVRKGLSIDRDEIKIVETKLKNVEYIDDTYTAEVEFLIRFYRIPFYIVTDSKEKQVWKFHLGDNWALVDRVPGKELSK